MTAILCVLAPLALPIGPVPMLATFFIYLSAYVLGTTDAAISVIVYILLGFVGLPVFSGYSGGAVKILGPTGGYIIGYIPLVLITGIFVSRYIAKPYLCMAGMILATAVLYSIGTIWLIVSTSMDPVAAMWAGMIPFIPGDIAKMILCILIGPRLKKAVDRI